MLVQLLNPEATRWFQILVRHVAAVSSINRVCCAHSFHFRSAEIRDLWVKRKRLCCIFSRHVTAHTTCSLQDRKDTATPLCCKRIMLFTIFSRQAAFHEENSCHLSKEATNR